jgi:hypothetical protein
MRFVLELSLRRYDKKKRLRLHKKPQSGPPHTTKESF